MKLSHLPLVLISTIVLFCITVESNAQTWTQEGIDIDGETETNSFGYKVSSSGNGKVIAIGSLQSLIKVYSWNAGSWTQRGSSFVGLDPHYHALSLSLDGNTLSLGGSSTNFQHVQVYDWNGSTWTQRGLDILGELPEEGTAVNVSLSDDGSTVAIGSPLYNGENIVGRVRIYSWNGSSWIQAGNDIFDDSEYNYDHGWSVSLSANGATVAIGAPAKLNNPNYWGASRIFAWNGTDWEQKGGTIDALAVNDRFGWSVSLSSDGDTVAIGAYLNVGSGQFEGSVRVFIWNGSTWGQKGNSIHGETGFDYSGYSISLSSDGNSIAIGAHNNEGDNGAHSGHVRIYSWDGSSWIQSGMDIDGEAENDHSGQSVSLSADGNVVVIGAPYNDGNGDSSGHVRVYSKISLGIIENDFGYNLRPYPNPTNGIFTVELGKMYSSVSAKVFGLKGQLINHNNYSNTDKLQLEINGVAGFYFVEIVADDNKKAIIKILKE